MFVYKSFKTFTNVSSSACRDTNLRAAVPSGDYPTKETRRESLAEVDFDEVFINVCRFVNDKLSGVHPYFSPKFCEAGIS
jgi:hypothetical protein